MGRKALEMLIKKITSNEKAESVIMPFEIIERDTVRNLYEEI